MRITSIPLHLRRLLLGTTALTGLAVVASSPAGAQGLPTGGTVVAGTATIAQPAANRLAVTTGTNRTVIDWQSFSIGSGNKVTIQQPGSSSITVNEVTGATPSQIFGDLSSNGRVVLANPNGIWFSKDSHVDVAGLVASTATMTGAAVKSFAAGGRLALDKAGSATASIVNDGHITIANQGLAALVAPGVRNDGVIQATLGQVTLAAGTTSTLDFYGDGLVSLAVTSPVTALAIGPDGKPFKAAIENNGTLSANGGHVLVTADVVKGVVDNVINMNGVVEAKGVTVAGGDIILDGGDGGVTVAATLDASATKAGQTGGSVVVTGGAVTLAATAKVDVSGGAGGGKVQIGGGPHGGGGVHHAQTTLVMGGAAINANAIHSGNGGTVSIWSDATTRFDGTISARGAGTGNGGWVETSSKGSLQVDGAARVDTSAPGGRLGSWLLDPTNLFIVTGGSDAQHVDPTSFEFSSTNVTLTATSNLTVSSEIDMSQAGLTLTAGHALTINAPIHLNGSGALALTGETSVNIGADISTAAGFISIQTGLGGVIDVGQGSHVTAAGPLSIFVDNTTLLSATDGAQITIGGSITADGIYIKAADQQFNQPNGFIEIQGTATLTNTGVSGNAIDASHADLLLFAGYGGHLQLDSGATLVAAAGNIALLADTLTIADSPANISTPGLLIISPSSTLGLISASNPGYNDFTGGAYSGSQAILGGTLPGGVTAITIGVGTDTEAFSVPQSMLDALNGTGTAGTINQVQIGLTNGNPTNVSGTLSLLNGLSIQGPVTLTGDTSITSTGAIQFGSTVDAASAGGQSLTLSAPTGVITFAGAIGGGTALNQIDFSAVSIALPDTVHTASDQNYRSPTTVSAATTITSDNGGITFFDTLQGNSPVTVSAVNGVATFENVVGGLTATTKVDTFTVTASSIVLTSVNSTGSQAYIGPVTLSGNVTFDAGTTQSVDFGSTVNGAGSLSVLSPVFFGGSVTTGGSQSYSNVAVLVNDATLTATGGITLGAIDSTASTNHALTLSDAGDAIVLNGPIGANTALSTLTVTGGSITLPTQVTTVGNQIYTGPATLVADSVFNAGTAGISFGGTLDGNFEAQVSGVAGVTFGGAVGGLAPLTNLTVTSNSIVLPSAVTADAQNYTGNMRLAGDTTLTGTSILLAGFVDGDSSGRQSLTIAATGAVEFTAFVGSNIALNDFSLTAASVTGGGIPTVSADGTQTYNVTAALNVSGNINSNGFSDTGPLTLTGTTQITGGTGGITISGTIDGAQALTLLDTSGPVALSGAIGSTTALTSLAVTSGSIALPSSVHTTGAQDYAGPVSLSTDGNFTADSGIITFESTVDGAGAFSVTAPGGISLVSTITTTGAQTYAGPVTLAGDTTINGSAVQFTGTIDGTTASAQSLTISVTGVAEFDGSIGGTTALNNFSLTAGSIVGTGSSLINATGTQTFDVGAGLTLTGIINVNGFVDLGPLLLTGDTTITAVSGNISIFGAVNGAHALTLVDSTGTIGLTGSVGATTALTNLNVTAAHGITLSAALITTGTQSYGGPITDGTGGAGFSLSAAGGTTLNGPVTTAGTQSYSGPVTLASNGSFTATAGAINLGGTVDGTSAGGQSLALSAVGGVQLSGSIGGTTAVSSFSATGPVTLQNSLGITTTGGGISFNGTLDNAVSRSGAFTLNAGGGDVSFAGLVGTTAALGNVTISNARNVTGPAVVNASLQSGTNEFRARSLTVGSVGSPITGTFTMPGGIAVNPGNNQTGTTTTGAIFINAAGAVSIGTLNSANPADDLGVYARGADVTTGGVSGNGGTITITGSSLSLTNVSARGGETETGSSVTASGGNGGTIILTATNGAVAILGGVNDDGISAVGGWSTLASGGAGGNGGTITVNATGAFTTNYVSVDGGAAIGGTGGNGGAITIDANTIALARARARGGDTETGPGGAAGGSVTLIATGNATNEVILTGNSSDFSGSSTAFSYGTLTARGGNTGVADAIGTDVAVGTIGGAGGTVTIEGSAAGAALRGAIELVNGAGGTVPTPGSTYQAGPDVLITASGTAGHGGTITILGSIVAADPGVESLEIGATNGTTTVTGNIGSSTGNALNSLVLSGNNGAVSVSGAVATTAVVDLRATGSLSVSGSISTTSYTTPITNSVLLDLGSLFSSSSGQVSLSGAYRLTSGGNFSSDSLTLTGTTVIDTSTNNSALSIGTIDGAFGLTLNAGTGSVAFTTIGSRTALSNLAINAGSISLGSVTTTGSQAYTGGMTLGGTYTANGFSSSGPIVMAGNTTINGGTGDITLGGTVNGAFGLALVSSNANIFFNGSVGTTGARVPSLSITGANNATVQNNSSLLVSRFTATNIGGTINFGDHSLESDDIVAIQATSVEGRIITTSSATINAGTVSGTIQGSSVSVTATGAVNATVTADTANISGDSFSGSVQATRSANIAANDISAAVNVSAGGASLSGANVSGTVTSAGLAQIAATQTVAENVTAGGITISGTAAVTGNYTSTGAPIAIVARSVDGNVTALQNGSVDITASQFIIGNVVGGDVALTAPFIDVNVTAIEVTYGSPFRSFPADITQVVNGSTSQLASNDQNVDIGNLTGPSDDDKDKKKKKSNDPVYDFANQYIDNLISGKTVH
ncbi:MAG TPA: filamentous hemagglutinin N-terminal domain-containing protein [Aliidongia sp.]|uniref:beta strand repeat-containing protein n=1 Tax=Aliidongia sp. TaxID=1914230 RepID=UPI002DDCF807|nr:filamentous hemagglutinin N-terminal domain-containing protein [Aliidongia sp.]HEV2676330.1 filamentous hemagglutinin N-terminal domain-containing protein [Aliidongia sp.]